MHVEKGGEEYSKSTEATGNWTTGLCGCCEHPWSCIKTFFCPCITFGQNAEIIDRNNTTCCCGCLVYYLLAYVGCSCLYTFTFRTRLRQQLSLPERPCADFFVHFFCNPCALCQEYRELKNRGIDPSKGWEANSERMNNAAIMHPPDFAKGMPR